MDMENTSQDLPYLICEVYRPILIENVKFSHLVSKMPFMREIAASIYGMDRNHQFREAAGIFFEHFTILEEEGKYTAFLNALKECGYTLISEAINRGGIHYDHEEHKRLLQLFTEELANSIDPFYTAQKLQERALIRPEDQEKISNLMRNESRKDAAFYLLDTVPRYKENWFAQFIEILIEDGQDEIAKVIDPKLFEKYKGVKTEELEYLGIRDRTLEIDKAQAHEQTGASYTAMGDSEDHNISSFISLKEGKEYFESKKRDDFMQKVDSSIEEQNKQLVLLNEKVDKITGMLEMLLVEKRVKELQ